MPDISLKSMTALGSDDALSETFGAITISERPEVAIASLAARSDAPDPISVFGLSLPGPGEMVSGDGITIVWSAPRQWMILGEGRGEQDFASDVKAAAQDCSITEQTDGFVCIDLVSNSGAQPLQDLLMRLVNLDPARLAPGCATRTLLEHMSVFLIRYSERRVAILSMRSSAQSLWHALSTAAGFAAHRAEVRA